MNLGYSLIAALLRHNELINQLRVTPEHLTAKLGMILALVVELIREVDRCDEPLAQMALEDRHPGVDWSADFDRIAGEIGSPGAFEGYQDAILRDCRKRRAKTIGSDLSESGDVEAAIAGLSELSLADQSVSYGMDQIVRMTVEGLQNPPKAIKTGLPNLDGKIGGLFPSDLVVIGARPSMGKTALAANIALRSDAPFLFVSGEQGAEQLGQRLVAIEGEIPLWKMRNNTLQEHDFDRLATAASRLKKRQSKVLDIPAPSLEQIQTEARKLKHEMDIQIVLVDYLQRMKTTGERREAVEANVRGLKELARELDIPVVVLAQVNRRVDQRPKDDRMPHMGDLLESGAIEAEADMVAMLYRPAVYDAGVSPAETFLSIEKNRHGPTGVVELTFKAESLRFAA